MADMRNAYKILIGKHEGKRPLGRSRRRWEDNIVKDRREMGWDVPVYWICMTQDRFRWRALMNMTMNFRVLSLTS
jgi:hypothetical protein